MVKEKEKRRKATRRSRAKSQTSAPTARYKIAIKAEKPKRAQSRGETLVVGEKKCRPSTIKSSIESTTATRITRRRPILIRAPDPYLIPFPPNQLKHSFTYPSPPSFKSV